MGRKHSIMRISLIAALVLWAFPTLAQTHKEKVCIIQAEIAGGDRRVFDACMRNQPPVAAPTPAQSSPGSQSPVAHSAGRLPDIPVGYTAAMVPLDVQQQYANAAMAELKRESAAWILQDLDEHFALSNIGFTPIHGGATVHFMYRVKNKEKGSSNSPSFCCERQAYESFNNGSVNNICYNRSLDSNPFSVATGDAVRPTQDGQDWVCSIHRR
jgi:hypothetical protein